MKKAYETPSAEMLEFDYMEVLTASLTDPEMTDTDQDVNFCVHMSGSGGYAFEDNHGCKKDPERSKNKKCY